jgi:hypothetical protein
MHMTDCRIDKYSLHVYIYLCHIFDDEQIPYQKHPHILLGNRIMQYFQWEPCLKVEVQALQGVA